MVTPIDTKDRIWSMLNHADGASDFCDVANRICDTLELTDGLWAGLDYSYKAQEICSHICTRLNDLSTTCQHHMTHVKISKTRQKACRLMSHFASLQSEAFAV